MAENWDLRQAINAVSDVVENRPRPLREFDQIYMKVADMVIQAHLIAERFAGKDVVFIGDGDAIGLSVMHLGKLGIFKNYPNTISILDFDERIVNSVNRFAEKYSFGSCMSAQLYNVVEALPKKFWANFDAFHTNPPWGASNEGESVLLFLERGIEAVNSSGEGAIVIADDPQLVWTQEVLGASQRRANELGFLVSEMLPQFHLYHLDDNPELRSCTCLFRRFVTIDGPLVSRGANQERLANFYGRDNPLTVKYVREVPNLNYGRASDTTYTIEKFGD